MNPTNVSERDAQDLDERRPRFISFASSRRPDERSATAPITLNARTRSASQPAGLPASRSFLATRSRASSGVTRRAIRPALVTIGTSTRLTEALRQLLLPEVHRTRPGASRLTWTPAAGRRAALGAGPSGRRTPPSRTIARRHTRSRETARSQTSISTIFLIQRIPSDEQDDGAASMIESDLRREQQADVVRVDREHVEPRSPNGRSASTQADSRPSAVSTRICRRIVARSRSVSATLSRISARFPPTSRWMFTASTAHLKSADADPLGERLERVLGRSAQSDLGDDPLELGRGGLRDLLGDRVERLEEAVARAERAGHDRQDVGQLFAQLLRAACRAPASARSSGQVPRGRPRRARCTAPQDRRTPRTAPTKRRDRRSRRRTRPTAS